MKEPSKAPKLILPNGMPLLPEVKLPHDHAGKLPLDPPPPGQMMVGGKHGHVFIQFHEPTLFVGIPPEGARNLADLLCKVADEVEAAGKGGGANVG